MAAATTVGEDEIDLRHHAIVHRLDCTSDIGWRKVMGYATSEDCLRVFSLVSVAFGRGAATLKRSAEFGPRQLVLATDRSRWAGWRRRASDRSIALDRMEAASIRFPKLKEVKVDLRYALADNKGFTDASRAPILARLCTFTFVTELDLGGNEIAVVPDAIGP